MVENYIRAIRTLVDSLGLTFDESLRRVEVPIDLRDEVRAKYEEDNLLQIRKARTMSGVGGPREWARGWDASTGYYWRAQRSYLIDKVGLKPVDVASLDDATDQILAHLEDPRPQGPSVFDVRGLVMGYVQSGKTANICALIAKCADAGYKLVIVLSGVHNSLRLQTQRRVNRALGLDPNGIPEPEPGRRWISLTKAELKGDFQHGTVDANVLQGNEHVVIVCKKNKSVLNRLIRWMENRAPQALPVLIIDDEADQASINTGGNRPPIADQVDLDDTDVDDPNAQDELDPSRINGLIRQLIRSFSRVSYVAYTATPFANILINHLAVDKEVDDDLYPRDFIVALPMPHAYTGAEALFGREALPGEPAGHEGLEIMNLVPETDADLLTPASSEVESYQGMVPASLRTALIDYILASAALLRRSRKDRPATMLIHTHHRTPVQNQLGAVVRDTIAQIRQTWRYDRGTIRPDLASRWETNFRPITVDVNPSADCNFEAIETYIDTLFHDPIPVLVLNSKVKDEADFDEDPNLKAVIIGGNRLSRGLTLDGLLVSYYVRKAETYDTLMQMGRWFGFREGYVDLTRIHTTAELAGWFRDLALAEEELRREIGRYIREGLTPLDFGPSIRSHPVMMITAPNKMGSAREIWQSYSAQLVATVAFRLHDKVWLETNMRAGQGLVESLGIPNDPSGTPQQPVWSGVPWRTVDAFLAQYQFDPRGVNEMGAIRQYVQARTSDGELVEWIVSIRGLSNYSAELGREPLLTVNGVQMNKIGRTRMKIPPYSIGSLVNPAILDKAPRSGDEELGLTDEQLRRARANVNEDKAFPDALREQRSPRQALLMLYPISERSRPKVNSKKRDPLFDDPDKDGTSVLGVALSFPKSIGASEIRYIVGSVGVAEQGV